MTQVAIAWNGLPFYAARLIRAGIQRVDVPVVVLGSKPSVPAEGMEETLGQPIHWIDGQSSQSWSELDVSVPDLFLQSGWSRVGFNTLGREVRAQGGKVILLTDHRRKYTLLQTIKSAVFRIRYKRWFDAAWVPGKSGRQFCKFLGMPDERIYEHLYGADPSIFRKGPPLNEREKQLLFVGQLIPRKGVDLLIRAFQNFQASFPEWSLQIIGAGEMEIPKDLSAVEVSGFVQPEGVAEAMRQSRGLILPSREDHWGLVVHEAALSGCALIVSNNVGAVHDLVTPKNGIVFESGSVKSLRKSIQKLASKQEGWWHQAEVETLKKPQQFGPGQWAKTFSNIISNHCNGNRQ